MVVAALLRLSTTSTKRRCRARGAFSKSFGGMTRWCLMQANLKIKIKIKAFVIATILPTTLCVFAFQIRGQEPTPSPSPKSTADNAGSSGDSTSAKPAPTPEPDFWHRETMTGDWGGTRSRWKESGVELDFKYVGIYQSIASGGTNEKSSLTNKAETTWKFDLGKVAGWKFWSSEIKAEWRFGGPALTGTGGINSTNTAGIIPG